MMRRGRSPRECMTERTLDLTLGLGPIRPAGARREAVMPREIKKSRGCGYKTIGSSPITAVFMRS